MDAAGRSLRLRDSSSAFRLATACSWLMALGLGARGFGGLRVGVCAAGQGCRGNSIGPSNRQSSLKRERGIYDGARRLAALARAAATARAAVRTDAGRAAFGVVAAATGRRLAPFCVEERGVRGAAGIAALRAVRAAALVLRGAFAAALAARGLAPVADAREALARCGFRTALFEGLRFLEIAIVPFLVSLHRAPALTGDDRWNVHVGCCQLVPGRGRRSFLAYPPVPKRPANRPLRATAPTTCRPAADRVDCPNHASALRPDTRHAHRIGPVALQITHRAMRRAMLVDDGRVASMGSETPAADALIIA